MVFSVNFFFAVFEFLFFFLNKLYGVEGVYVIILIMGVIGLIIGVLIVNKFKLSMNIFLFLLILIGVGVFMMGLFLFNILIFFGNLICEFFMMIFNIYFFI